MPRNVEAIRKWVRLNRPDMVEPIDGILGQASDSLILLMTSAFEAGRMFQADETANPAIYIPMEEVY